MVHATYCQHVGEPDIVVAEKATDRLVGLHVHTPADRIHASLGNMDRPDFAEDDPASFAQLNRLQRTALERSQRSRDSRNGYRL